MHKNVPLALRSRRPYGSVTSHGVSRPEAPPPAAPACCGGMDGLSAACQGEGPLRDYTLGHHTQCRLWQQPTHITAGQESWLMSKWTHLQKSQFVAWNGDALSISFIHRYPGALLVKQQQQSGSPSDPEFQGKSGRGRGRDPDGAKTHH